ncbi:hypothetical protein AB4084_05460 [Lysobacter sp. 2RAB21]
MGFVLVVPDDAVAATEADLKRLGLSHWRIGEVVGHSEGERVHIG